MAIKSASPTNPHVHALFEYTRARVTEQHIFDFSPGDPGYPAYVQMWTQILRTEEIPVKPGHLSEVINLTGWASRRESRDPRFREYRRFTSAVAAANCEVEYPFFTFGAIVLAQMAGDYEEAARLAAQLIADESAVRHSEFFHDQDEARFLLGLTVYDQLHAEWICFAQGLTNPTGSLELQLVMDALGEKVR